MQILTSECAFERFLLAKMHNTIEKHFFQRTLLKREWIENGEGQSRPKALARGRDKPD
jgi:hypothetical protein